MELFFFIIFAVIAVVSAVAVVTLSNTVHSALSLMVCLFQVAALFVLLRSPFLAAIQIFIYVGAVVVLFLFAVMVLNLGKSEFRKAIFHKSWWGVFLVGLFFLEGAYFILRGNAYHSKGVYSEAALSKSTEIVGKLLFTKFIFPFEVVSVLLLVALVGAVVLIKRDNNR